MRVRIHHRAQPLLSFFFNECSMFFAVFFLLSNLSNLYIDTTICPTRFKQCPNDVSCVFTFSGRGGGGNHHENVTRGRDRGRSRSWSRGMA